MIISARQLQDQHVPLYQVFVDLTKTFDIVNWKFLGSLDVLLDRSMKVHDTFNGLLSDEISIDNGVKQGDILVVPYQGTAQ